MFPFQSNLNRTPMHTHQTNAFECMQGRVLVGAMPVIAATDAGTREKKKRTKEAR